MSVTTVKERPILFSGPMVRAILNGHKTQTRRIVKPQESIHGPCNDGRVYWIPADMAGEVDPCCEAVLATSRCPYGQPDDRLWVREAWRLANINARIKAGQFWTVQFEDYAVLPHPQPDQGLFAPLSVEDTFSESATGIEFGRWRSSMQMPRWVSRITLEITGVRVERLQEISHGDAIAEGIHSTRFATEPLELREQRLTLAQLAFSHLWDSINGLGSWDANPWVWVVEFKRLEGGAA